MGNFVVPADIYYWDNPIDSNCISMEPDAWTRLEASHAYNPFAVDIVVMITILTK